MECLGTEWGPRGYILKSLALASRVKFLALASKPQVLENCLVLGSRTALFFEPLNFCWKTRNPCGKFAKTFFFWRSSEKNFENLFFGEHLRLCPWPRAFLSLASRGSVLGRAVLGLGIFFVPLALASSLVSSTTPLLCKIS